MLYSEVKSYIESFGCELLSKVYKNTNSNLKIKCCCGRVFQRSLDNFRGKSKVCRFCVKRMNESSGERKIREFLIKNNIKFEPEFTFDDCKNIRLLPFDFAVFNNLNQIELMIEYDGEQHFNFSDFFGGEEKFKKLKHNENIKNEYCKNNNIPLLRISYKEFKDIEEILEYHLLYN